MGKIYKTVANPRDSRSSLEHVTISRIFINGTIIEFYVIRKQNNAIYEVK
jgi:hypothetical protein